MVAAIAGRGFRDGAGDDPLGVALGAGPLDQKALRGKAMGTAYVFSKAGQGAGNFGADSKRARRAGVLMKYLISGDQPEASSRLALFIIMMYNTS